MRVLAPRSLALWIFAIPIVAASLAGADGGRGGEPRFEPASACLACHNGLATAAGEDVSIGAEWRGSIMANASRDPYWQASVRRETLDHPEHRETIEDECATCHMPMARAEARAAGGRGAIFAHLPIGRSNEPLSALAADGVSCTLCHQIQADAFGHPESFSGGFTIDLARPREGREIFGPYAIDAGRTAIMQSSSGFRPAESSHVRQSELCATCHTLYTTPIGAGGETVGRLPEQVPYLEWRHSAYREERSCQSCHMPAVTDGTPFSSVLGESRTDWARHSFRGGNVFMIRLLNRYRAELGVAATPGELEASARTTLAHLQGDTARVAIAQASAAGGRLVVDVDVRNLAGHKLPTGYPSRRVWLHVRVRDGGGRTVFESGAIARSGAIAGNDNDADPTAFEPHYREIRRADQVQIYESVMTDANGGVTTALLRGVRFVKDNRLLPRGFDKARADADIAVRGAASADDDFTGGTDRVRYDVTLAGATGPFTVDADLVYQPIAFRWAQNLRQQRADEIDRFVAYYESMSESSSVRLAGATVTVASAAPRP